MPQDVREIKIHKADWIRIEVEKNWYEFKKSSLPLRIPSSNDYTETYISNSGDRLFKIIKSGGDFKAQITDTSGNVIRDLKKGVDFVQPSYIIRSFRLHDNYVPLERKYNESYSKNAWICGSNDKEFNGITFYLEGTSDPKLGLLKNRIVPGGKLQLGYFDPTVEWELPNYIGSHSLRIIGKWNKFKLGPIDKLAATSPTEDSKTYTANN